MSNDFSWQVIEYLFCLFEVGLFLNFLSNILKKKYENYEYIYILSGFSMALIIFGVSKVSFASLSTILIGVTVYSIFAFVLYQGKISTKLIYALVFFMILGLIDIITANILAVILAINLGEVIITEKWFRVLLFTISKSILFIVLKSISYFKGNSTITLPKKYWYMIIGMFSASIIILFIIGEIGINTAYSIGKEDYFIIASIGMLAINIFIYYIIIKLNLYYQKDKTYAIISSKNEVLEKYYREQEESNNEIRKLRHDFNNHILCMSSLAKNNNLDDLNIYLANINNYLADYGIYVKSGNDIVDAVLNNKMLLARKNNIDIKISAYVPEKINISHMDLCAILSNLLDNAIESCLKIDKNSSCRIDTKINQYKGKYLSITVLNTTINNPIKKSFNFKTTKNDSKSHGFGMKIIKTVVDKYDGCINYECKDNTFKVKILLKYI